MSEDKRTIEEKILSKAKEGELKMKSKAFFVAKSGLLLAGIVILASALVYMITFVIFLLQRSGYSVLPEFGISGIRILLSDFPWMTILLIIAFILVLELLVKHYKIAYSKPIVYSSLFVIAILAVTSIVVRSYDFHGYIFSNIQEGKLKVVKPLYGQHGMKASNSVHPGLVKGFTENGFIFIRLDGYEFEVSTTTKTHYPIEEIISAGDYIVVIGEPENHHIEAYGIHRAVDQPKVIRRLHIENQ